MAFEIKKNDRRPYYRVQLLSNNVPIDLTTASAVKFYMRLQSGGTLKVNATASFIDRVNGIVEYAWGASDTNASGSYVAEFEINWGASELQTFPSTGYFTITVNDDLI